MMRVSMFLPAPQASLVAAHWLKSAAIIACIGSSISAGLLLGISVNMRPTDEFGAEALVEFATIVTSAESDASSAAPLSDAEDRPATSDLAEVLSKTVEHDLPSEQASPLAPTEEDLRMAQERTQTENERAEADLQATEAMEAQSQSVSSQSAAATDAAEAIKGVDESVIAAAPDHGNSATGQRRIAEWQRRLFGHIAKHKTYPEAARQKHLTGEAMIAFRMGRDGNLQEIHVEKTSGHETLDRAALDVMRRASPLPALPAELKGDAFEFSLPMRFSLK